MKTKDFDYILPQELIAQEPLQPRDSSRLLVVNRRDGSLQESFFKDIVDFFVQGDILVLNRSKVIAARLWACKPTGAKIEVLLLEENQEGAWEVLLRPSRRLKIKDVLIFSDAQYTAEVLERTPKGTWLIRFKPWDIKKLVAQKGVMPTPPYIKKPLKDYRKYQTVFAEVEGSVAAPTAGLHFTEELLLKLKAKGVSIVYITLHVGLGTFRSISAENIEDHRMDSEYYQIDRAGTEAINAAKDNKKRIFACGTSAVRALESSVCSAGCRQLKPLSRKTDLFIYPGFKFKVADSLITNFHVPRSTNLLLISAFAGKGLVDKAYQFAIEKNYRFYSFGDAMLVL
ncbi:MAG: tRNA preQ1(34) S-adenosylmethionine ribosyltransferase-isomerase QueA [Candidatus Omnitrophica bacterium]|nr:tRNA preQ1(34) S-adenosylmethionine ribosyltransferase-isomerase QueA [Candidatus Omnitrophota bacterium]